MTRQAGIALLESVVALVVLGTIGSAAAWSASEWTRSVDRTITEEQQLRSADHLLSAISLWTRADLDRHLGRHAEGQFRMGVNRIEPTLYEVILADTASGAPVLATLLYRVEDGP